MDTCVCVAESLCCPPETITTLLISGVLSCSVVPDSVTPWTVAHQTPLSVEFSRQEYWNGLPFPSLEDLPNPGFEPGSATLQADSLPSEPPGKPNILVRVG